MRRRGLIRAEARLELLKKISLSIENGDSSTVKELVKKALELNLSPEDILNNALIKGMNVVGKKFKENEVFIPEVLIATRAMKAGMDIIRPYLAEQALRSRGKIIIGTVKGDLHDIGKKIVIVMLEKEGYEIIDLGIDVAKEKFVKEIKKERPQLVGMSALLTTTMGYMREVIEAVEKEGLRKSVKIIIGGAPITQSYATEIRADGYAKDAQAAVTLVNHLGVV
jgi:5-methyltetrahydrofolate--homocysteine methyltransferase